ncbi:hypothetical protein DI494_22135, partial [Stenotrophomonas maltophilia]
MAWIYRVDQGRHLPEQYAVPTDRGNCRRRGGGRSGGGWPPVGPPPTPPEGGRRPSPHPPPPPPPRNTTLPLCFLSFVPLVSV